MDINFFHKERQLHQEFFCKISFHFMKKIATVSGIRLAFSTFLGEKYVGVNYDTFSVGISKSYAIWLKTELEFPLPPSILLRLQLLFHSVMFATQP